MGLRAGFGASMDEPEWVAAEKKFFDAMNKHDKPYGGFALINPPIGGPEKVKKAAERMSFLGCSIDMMHLSGMAKDIVDARNAVAEVLDASNKTGTANGEEQSETNGSRL